MKTKVFGVCAVIFLSCGIDTVLANTAGSASWSVAASMSTARDNHIAILLPNGKVLVTGGQNSSGVLATAELYNPATGTWSNTGSMTTAHTYFHASLLPNGKVLVEGGRDNSGKYISTAEIYDPTSGTWSVTGSMFQPHADNTLPAVLLPNGKVLVAGGSGASTELYDSATGTWSVTSSMNSARTYFPTVLLLNGKVLTAGGWSGSSVLASAELYDPATGNWSATSSMSTPYHFHTAALLQNGKVLVAGGYDASWNSIPISQIYDPATGTWSQIGSNPAGAVLTATRLSNGKVLAVGGGRYSGTVQAIATADLYDPVTNTWSASIPMNTARGSHTATLLPSGKVLVAGGCDGVVNFATAELYTPDNTCSDEIAVKPYTFTAGTPAKAAEINANFVSFLNVVESENFVCK